MKSAPLLSRLCHASAAMRGLRVRRVAFQPIGPVAVIIILVLVATGVAGAAPAPDPASQTTPAGRGRERPDFWFGHPAGSLSIRGGWLFARTGSDLFTFLHDQLTIEDGDFNAGVIGGDVGVYISPRVDAFVGVDFSRASTVSEYRNFVDNDRLPIAQDTWLTTVDLSGSIKVALTPRGREIGRLAWIPRTLVPYAGGGAGLLWYRLEQLGDFVDFVDLSVFRSGFSSSGWTPSAHLFGGVDVRVWRRLFLVLEGRYCWAEAELQRDFSGFEPIDLSGFRLTTGINVVF